MINDWLNTHLPATRRAYQAANNSFLGHSSGDFSSLISQGRGKAYQALMEWRTAMVNGNEAAATINLRLSAARSFLRYARLMGLIDWTVEVQGVRRVPYRDTAGPGREAIVKMLGRFDPDDRLGLRNRCLLRMLYELALRSGEAKSLDVRHFQPPYLYVSRKGEVDRQRMRLSSHLATELAQLLRMWPAGPDEPLLRSKSGKHLRGNQIYAIIRKVGGEIGIKTRPHGIRHSGITEAAENHSLLEVVVFANHKDPTTIKYYLDNKKDAQATVTDTISLD